MSEPIPTEDEVIEKLFQVQAIKFGQFKLKSGISSPLYLDLRVMISYPILLKQCSELVWQKVKVLEYATICGVPYTALPISTCISLYHNVPMLVRRKEAKDYGTRKMLEGIYSPQSNCVVIEDVVTSGSSIKETVDLLRSEGLEVTNAVVLINRDQGGSTALHNIGVTLHSVFSLTSIMNSLLSKKLINKELFDEVTSFLSVSRFDGPTPPVLPPSAPSVPMSRRTFEERRENATNPLSKQLYSIIIQKKSNLAFSADVTKSSELLDLVSKVGDEICLLKTHIDVIEDFSHDVVLKLEELAKKHQFLILEDRKFADIGNTVKQQYVGGVHKISEWSHLVTCHGIAGSGLIKGLKEGVAGNTNRGALLLAQLSSEENLITPAYTQRVLEFGQQNEDFIAGFVTQERIEDKSPNFIYFTPGVKLEKGRDNLGQVYNSPSVAVTEKRSDVIIVGRGILASSDPLAEAKKYKEEAWAAYLSRVNSSAT